MNDASDFYEKLDLKYPEVAIAIDRIDRLNPQPTRFIIPILTPSMPNRSISTSRVYQNKTNLQNLNKDTVEVDTIDVCNYITLPLTKEVCGIIYCDDTTTIPNSVRYINPWSKWLVVFVGGDITNPRIISRYE